MTPSAALAAWLHRFAAYVLLPTIVLLSSVEIVCRYVLASPSGAAEEYITAALLMAFFGSIPCGVASGAHVRVETLYEGAAPRWRRRADRLADTCGAVFFGLLGWGLGIEALGMLDRGDVSEVGNLPQWPIAGFVCAVSMGTALWFCARFFGPARQ